MIGKISTPILALIVISGCTSMKPTDFSETTPVLRIEEYFVGQTRAWGIFEDRFGNLRRQFVVDIQGSWDGESLILDEKFLYRNGDTDRRIWTIKKFDEHRYEGRTDNLIGTAIGESYGNALNWRYDMNLKVGKNTLQVHFNDWMFLQPSSVLVNRARVSKFGIEIGEVTLFFQKIESQSDVLAVSSNVPTHDDVKMKLAYQ